MTSGERSMWVCDGGPVECTNATADRETSATQSRTKPNGVVERLFFNNDGRAARMIREKGANELKDRSLRPKRQPHQR